MDQTGEWGSGLPSLADLQRGEFSPKDDVMIEGLEDTSSSGDAC